MSEEAEKTELYKTQLKVAGIVAGIFVVFFALLVLFALLARGQWNKGLRLSVENTLSDAEVPFNSLEPVELRSTSEVNCAVFKDSQSDMYVAIIRITTIYGPLPAVYTYTKGRLNAEFVSFAELHSKAASQITNASLSGAVDYWAKKLPAIIQSAPSYKEEAR